MRRTLVTAAVVLTGMVVPGLAGGTAERGFENDYAGSVKNIGKNYFGFDKEGRNATNFSSYFHYDGPCDGEKVLGFQSTDELKIKHKKFKGMVTGSADAYDFEFKLRGKLLPGHKAKGRIKATVEKDGEGTCTGPRGKWTAEEPPSR